MAVRRSESRSRARRGSRFAAPVALALLLGLPGVAFGVGGAAPIVAPNDRTGLPTTIPAPAASSLDGARGTSQPLASAADLAHYLPWGGRAKLPQAPLKVPAAPGAIAAPSLGRLPFPFPPAPPPRSLATPGRLLTNNTTGMFRGFVNDSDDRRGVGDVNVTTFSTALCSGGACGLAVSAANGSFSIPCAAPGGPADDYAIEFSTPWWVTNLTYATCVGGAVVPVGTIYLVRDGIARGVVREAGTGGPVAGVLVGAFSRDGTVAGEPTALTSANGSFEIAVPPEPSIVQFAPPSDYLATFNFTNATPGLGHRPNAPPWTDPVDLGITYLTRLTLVRATLVDTSTEAPVGAGVLDAITPCDPVAGVGGGANACAQQGEATFGPHPEVWVLPGPAYFQVYAVNFAYTVAPTTTVPAEPPGTPFDLPIWVVPDGEVPVESNLSTPTGGHATWPIPATTVPSLAVEVCTLSGYAQPYVVGTNLSESQCLQSACVPAGAAGLVPAPPLRDSLEVVPATVPGLCAYGATWPDDGPTPVWGYTAEVNVTAGRTLPTLLENLTPGDYVAGTVAFPNASTLGGPPCTTLDAVSTDSSALNALGSYSWNTCDDGANSSEFAPCAGSIPRTLLAFCLAVPPGDSRVVATADGDVSNWTWVSVPRYCCHAPSAPGGYPESLANATEDHVRSINLTPASGLATGWLVAEGGGSGSAINVYAVAACNPYIITSLPCTSQQVDDGPAGNGSFSANVTAGPENLAFVAPGYAQDSVWTQVPGGGSIDVGTVPVLPLGGIAGRVVDPDGSGIYAADVSDCLLDSAEVCFENGGTPLGIGFSATDGSFNGSAPGGRFPGATYLVVVDAPGYVEGWEFANVTPGRFTQLPPLTLEPVGAEPSRPAPAARPASALAAVWVTGRLVSSVTGAGVPVGSGATLDACAIGGGACTALPDGTNSEGFFNGSVTPGLYDLNFSAPGVQPLSTFFNATGVPAVDLGSLQVTADEFVTGRVAFYPWLSVTDSSGGTFGAGYAPPVDADACSANGLRCTGPLQVSANGTFNLTVVPGPRALVEVPPDGEFAGNSTLANLTGDYTTISDPAFLGVAVFGWIAGVVRDANGSNLAGATGALAPGLPDALVQVTIKGATTVAANAYADASGRYVIFLPGGSGPAPTTVDLADPPGYDGNQSTTTSDIPWGGPGPLGLGGAIAHYGWVVGRFDDPTTGTPAANAEFVVAGIDPGQGGAVNETQYSDADGLVNVTAPPGGLDTITSDDPEFNATPLALGSVTFGLTTFLNGSGYTSLRPVPVASLGELRSTELIFDARAPPLAHEPPPAIADALTGAPLAGAVVRISSSDPSLGTFTSLGSNALGEFDSQAPIGAADRATFYRPGYALNSTRLSVDAGDRLLWGRVNLTGDTVVAGTAVSRANGSAVSGAAVTVCSLGAPFGTTCSSTLTNGSGTFWTTAPPGTLRVWINASGYLPNSASASGCTDCWVSVGTVVLQPDGGVEGTVRALPSGFLVPNATVALCPAALFQGAPCGANVSTSPTGTFYLPAQPGSWELIAYAPGYNVTDLPLDISAGEIADVGTLFLLAYGSATGAVIDGTDGLGIDNATVYPCPTWSGSPCAPATTTDARGDYRFVGPAGPYLLSVYADGYLSATGKGTLVAASSSALPNVALYPIGDNTPISLSGRVVLSNSSSRGVGDAEVSATQDGAVAFSTTTSADGAFDLPVAFGSYEVVATKVGFAPDRVSVDANGGSIANLLLLLGPEIYEVVGNATDGLTGAPLPGVTIYPAGDPSAVAATSAPDGSFSFGLPNGSFPMEATGDPAGPVAYALDRFTVVVDGAAVRSELSLAPQENRLEVQVVDAASGLPVPGATVVVQGAPEPGYRYRASYTTAGDGTVSLTLYDAGYLITVLATGYAPADAVRVLNASPSNLTVPLAAAAAGGATTPAFPLASLELTAGALAAAGAIAVVLRTRRARRSPDPEGGSGAPPTLDDPYRG